ncbi:MAG: hypothetical protein PF489_12255, partial [Salinivirgaceae bacterium]|nr:hypothetical protein [Salinivirgaceae bacterium]
MLNNLPVKIISTIILLLLRMALLSQDQIITPVEIPDSKDFIGRVNCIFQDRIGFIWIGKESGLYRYDGNEMKAFRHDPNDTSTISCNFVRAINEDSLGNLWIGTNGGGLNYYHRKSGKFSRYLHNEKDTNSISFDQLSTIFPDGKGNLWIGTDGGGLNFFDPATGKFRSFRAGENPTKKLKSNKILHISPTTNGKYWLSTWGGGVHLFNPVSKEIKHIGNGTKYKKCNVFCAKEVKPGILWLATFDEGLVEYNIKSAKFTTLIARVGVDSFSDIQVTSSGEIFVASNNGLLFFPSATSECRYVESATSYFYTITAIFIDRTQTLWVGNGPGWIGKINSFKKQFHTLPTSSPFKEASVNAVHIDKISGKTFFAFKNQLIECDLFTNRYQSYDLPFKFFNSMIEIPEMNILLCPSTNGIVLFDKNSGRISPMEFGKNSPIELLKEGIRSFYPADSIGVWVAATSAAYKINFDLESKNWEITNVIPIGTENGISNCHFPTCFLRHPNG